MDNQATESRRQLYRVEVGSADPVEATLSIPGWPAILARISDATADGVGLEVPEHIPLPIVNGQEVELTFWLVGQNRAVTLHGEIIGSHDGLGCRRVGIRFQEPSTAYRELAGNLGSVFNRRNAPRVAPEMGTRVTMIPAQACAVGPISGSVQCISATGMGVALRPVDHDRILGDQLNLSVGLERGRQPLELAGTIRNVSTRAGRVIYGISFDGHEPPVTRERIETYVHGRKAALSS